MNECNECRRLKWANQFGSFRQKKYENEYCDGLPRLFLNQNGELIRKYVEVGCDGTY